MFDVIKIAFDSIIKVISLEKIIELRKEKKIGDIGARLYLIYIDMNKIIIYGESIKDNLQTYITRMSNHLSTGNDKYALTAGKRINGEIELQIQSLVNLSNNMKTLFRELAVLDAESYYKMELLTDRKTGALRVLSRLLESGYLPLTANKKIYKVITFNDELSEVGSVQRYLLKNKIRDLMLETCVSRDKDWEETEFKIIKEFIESGELENQLNNLKIEANKLYLNLKENFSTSDILLRVGDEKLKYLLSY